MTNIRTRIIRNADKVSLKWWWLFLFQITRNIKVLEKHNIHDYTNEAYEYWESKCKEEDITVPYSYFRYWHEHLLIDCGFKTRLHPQDYEKQLKYKCPKGYVWGDLPRSFKSQEKWI